MKTENIKEIANREELPDEWWYRVYVGVLITNILVISALWIFSQHFSK